MTDWFSLIGGVPTTAGGAASPNASAGPFFTADSGPLPLSPRAAAVGCVAAAAAGRAAGGAPPARPPVPSRKRGVRERRYTVLQLRAAAHRILATARCGKQLSASTAALEQGAPAMRCTLSRLMERVWARGGAASYSEAWLARSDLIDAFQFKTRSEGHTFGTHLVLARRRREMLELSTSGR